MMTVTVTPATTGRPIASKPATIISTLSTIDQVVALRMPAVISFAMSSSFHRSRSRWSLALTYSLASG